MFNSLEGREKDNKEIKRKRDKEKHCGFFVGDNNLGE